MATSSYLTISRAGQAEIEDRRSRFRCALHRVETEKAAREVIAATRTEHWDARHHCSAMILRPDAAVQRSHDDGEPAGTAGAPMLEVLRGREVSDVLAVVTRWFGGALLGAGGLARAYGDAVREAIDGIPLVRRVLVEQYWLSVEHARVGRIENEIRARGVEVVRTEYAESARICVGVASGRRGQLESTLAEVTGGTVHLVAAERRWQDAPIDP